MINVRFALLTMILLVTVVGCSETQTGTENRMEIVENLYLREDVAGRPSLELEGPVNEDYLEIVDLVVGTGQVGVTISDTLEVNYLGIGSITGFAFDSSFSRNEPATFPLGAVIQGWQQGLIGMREGGRRVLIIPSSLAYGPTPPPGSGIEPNEALIFLVDLIKIN